MAIPRMLNSNTPFVVVTGGSGLSFLGKQDGQECEEEKDSLAQAIAPHLSRMMEHGTAKHVSVDGRDESGENPHVSIIAQAEGEGSQEFTPTNTQYRYSKPQLLKRHRSLAKKTALMSDTEDGDIDGPPILPHCRLRRKQRRKTTTTREEGEEPPVIQGLWVQEIDWLRSVDHMSSPADIIPPPPQFTDGVDPCSHLGGVPEALGGVPEALGGVPKALGGVPKALGGVPKALGGVPEALGGVPEALGVVPKALGEVTEALGVVPKALGGVPKALGGVPKALAVVPMVPKALGGVPKALGVVPMVPKALGGVPEALGGVTKALGGVPKALGGVPQACAHEGAPASRCSCAAVYECVSRLEEVSLSEDQCGCKEAEDPCGVGGGAASDSDCSLQRESQASESDSSCCDSVCCSEEMPDSLSSTHAVDGSRAGGVVSGATFDLMGVSGFNSSPCHAERDQGVSESVCSPAGCAQSLVGDASQGSDMDPVLDVLRGRVAQMPRHFAPPFFRDLMRNSPNEWKSGVHVNEGILFHHQLHPNGSRYREGEEYCVLHHIQNGSYGDVFCIRDRSSGFECAAKRIPLSHFSSEEVSTWSALNSPRVVELFGAVREGLNVLLFMDLKPGCLAQLLKERGSLPEDLALHYLRQLLGALEHLHHRRVLHLDVKVDNVLLSADGRDAFLCDFGLSETLDDSGRSTNTSRGSGFPGTETHMAPEVARGDQRGAKADVWSSCCMLLHMLNGCHPWIRYYAHPLCLKIVNEPPPLWEMPSNCNHFTAKVFRAGLQKDPSRRASARELRKKTTKALRAVGGLSCGSIRGDACEKVDHGESQNGDPRCTLSSGTSPAKTAPPIWVSPWRTRAADEDSGDWEEVVSELDRDSEVETDSLTREWQCQPKSLRDDYVAEDKDWETGSDSEVDIYMGEEECSHRKGEWMKNDRAYEGDWEEEEEEDDEWDSSSSTDYFHALQVHFPLLQRGRQTTGPSWGSEPELEYLRDGVAVDRPLQSPSPEPRDHPPSCFSCSDTSQINASDKDSDLWSDDLSSGVFSSYNSQTDGHLEWLVTAMQPSSCCFEGVDIWIENIHGECLRIRERRKVKVGHVAIGISDQISVKAFSLETLDRKTVSFQQEIQESGLWLCCVPAPDRCQRWSWRINDGKLELRE